MKVNEFSKMIGIADSKIRYYDRKGLITSERKHNNYRDYDAQDVLNIYHAQMLRSLDISIEDSITAMGESFETIGKRVDNAIEFLEEEIKRKQIMLNRLKDIKKHFHRIQNEWGEISYHYRPKCYNLCHIGEMAVSHEGFAETVEKLAAVMPFSYIAIQVKKESILDENGPLDVRIGLGIIEENCELLTLTIPDWVENTPKGMTVQQYFQIENPFEMTKEDIKPLLEELDKNGISITEDIFGRISTSYQEEGKFVHGIVLAYRIP